MHENFVEFDTNTSLKHSGAGLSEYRNQLAQERSTRSLVLRRSARPSIAAFLGKKNHISQNSSSSGISLDAQNFPVLLPSNAVIYLNTKDKPKILELTDSILSAAQGQTKLLFDLANSKEFAESLTNALVELDENFSVLILQTIGAMYPISPSMHELYIDAGLSIYLIDLISSSSSEIVLATVQLIAILSDTSSYARDAVLCNGLLLDLIKIASTQNDPHLTTSSCLALKIVFSSGNIDSDTISSCIKQMASLLYLENVNSVQYILQCFVSITNTMPAVIFDLFDLGLFPKILDMLRNPHLLSYALPLIGNLSISHVNHVKCLLDEGLFPILCNLIDSDYTADVFWVFSNLIESIPHVMMSLFDINFIHTTIQITANASYDVKKEVVFFISTLILFSESNGIAGFIIPEVIEAIIEMLRCAVNMIVLRCLDVLFRFGLYIQSSHTEDIYSEYFHNEELQESLLELAEQESSSIIRTRAEYLLNLLQIVTNQ